MLLTESIFFRSLRCWQESIFQTLLLTRFLVESLYLSFSRAYFTFPSDSSLNQRFETFFQNSFTNTYYLIEQSKISFLFWQTGCKNRFYSVPEQHKKLQ